MDKEIKTSNKQDQKLIKAMKKRLQKIGTEEKLPPSQKPSFGPSKKFLEKKRRTYPEIKSRSETPYHTQDISEKDFPKRPKGLGAALRGGGRAFNKGGKV